MLSGQYTASSPVQFGAFFDDIRWRYQYFTAFFGPEIVILA